MSTSNLHKWATLPDPSPAELARAAEGDAQAFKLIVERYQGMVYSVAYNVLGNHTDAEDAAQEAFLRCYRKLPQFRSEATFSTWLFRLALTAAVDYQRRERRRPEAVETPELAAEAAPQLGGRRVGQRGPLVKVRRGHCRESYGRGRGQAAAGEKAWDLSSSRARMGSESTPAARGGRVARGAAALAGG